MAAHILQLGCTIACPHQGQASVVAGTSKTKVDGKFALLVNDTATIAGCTFTLPSGSPSPCLTIRWTGPATKTKVSGTPVLLETSVALCLNAAQAPQGTATISGVQTKVSGT
jgi:hypothetical protein